MLQLADSNLTEWLWNVEPGKSNDLRWQFVCQIIHGVASIHQRNILHLDLKPGNILIIMNQTSACAKIGDFGLSQNLGVKGTLVINGNMAYSSGYRPYEAVLAGKSQAGLGG